LPNLPPAALNGELPDEPVSDVEESDYLDLKEKPQKPISIKCDSVTLPPPLPTQPLEIPKATPEEETQPAVQKSHSKPKLFQPDTQETNESPAPETNRSRIPIDPVQIPQQVTEEISIATKDESVPTHTKPDSPKLEFSLPQPHLAQKEIDQPAPLPPLPPDQSFVQSNHPKILTAIHGQLLPNGGSMHIRLDPPELGALAVQIDVRDGVVTASFQTSNDQATRLLSHSLTQLRTTLESAGITVEKLQVQQSPREHFASGNNDRDRHPNQQAYERSGHDDRQRREMLQRLWRRLTVGRDNLDLVA